MRIIHFADTHLGMTNFGRLDTNTGMHTRVMDYIETMDTMIDSIRHMSKKPDVILFAGDAFRTRTPNPTLEMHYVDAILKLSAMAPIIAVLGNHDRHKTGTGKRPAMDVWEHLASKNQITVASEIQSIYMDAGYIVTLPWFYDKDFDAVCDELDAALGRTTPGMPVILLGHCGVEGAELSAGGEYSYDLGRDFCMPMDVFADPDLWTYVALGHVHKHQCMCDDPPVVYAGSIERIDWGERHDGGKGFVVVDIDDGKVKWEFVDLQVRRMLDIHLDISEVSELSKMDATDAIVRITMTAARKKRKYAPRQMVMDHLPEGCYYVDDVKIVVPEAEPRRKVISSVASTMEPIDAIRALLKDKFPDDKRYVRTLMREAKAIIQEVDSERD